MLSPPRCEPLPDLVSGQARYSVRGHPAGAIAAEVASVAPEPPSAATAT